MEKGNNKVFIAIIIMLGLMVIGLGGYLIYENKELKNQVDDNNSKVTNKEEVTTPIKENNTSDYSSYLNNLKVNLKRACEEVSSTDEDGVICEGQTISGYGKFLGNFYFDISKDGKLTMSGSDSNLKNYEISSNVLQVFISSSGGNGGYQFLYFIKEDGSLNQFCIDCLVIDNEKEVKTTSYSNIVNVVSTDAGPLFIDINGNVYHN